MNIKIKRVTTRSNVPSKIPSYLTPGASGFDIRVSIDRSIELGPGNRQTLPTGLAFEIPEGFELRLTSRSGLASRHGILVVPGTVDSDYRGEVKIVLYNSTMQNYTIQDGDRVAQGILSPIVKAEFELVDELSKTDRGSNGFGSTGSR